MASREYFLTSPLLDSNGNVIGVIQTEKDLEDLRCEAESRSGYIQTVQGSIKSANTALQSDDNLERALVPSAENYNNPEATLLESNVAELNLNDGEVYDEDLAMKRNEELPVGWGLSWSPQGDPFFIDYKKGTTTWTHPEQNLFSFIYGAEFNIMAVRLQHLHARGPLPSGWEMKFDSTGKVYFQKSCTQEISWLDPRSGSRLGHDILNANDKSPWWIHNPAPEELAVEAAAKHFPSEVMAWWIEDPCTQEDNDVNYLCHVCRHINFRILLYSNIESVIPLGPLSVIIKKRRCAFCRLVASIAQCALSGLKADQLQSKDSRIMCELDEDPDLDRYTTHLRRIRLKLVLSMRDGNRVFFAQGSIQEIANASEPRANDYQLVQSQVNVELLKEWLGRCEKEHNSHIRRHSFRSSTLKLELSGDNDPQALILQPCTPVPVSANVMPLKVINVVRGCIEDVAPTCRYIALSYVWGDVKQFLNEKVRQAELEEEHSVSITDERIPWSIRDAMKLVVELGERYLWVDSLCIIQDDSEPNKMAQIANMGNIYSSAILTVVAAAGHDANAGLPGIRPRSRRPNQYSEQIQGMRLVNALPSISETVDQSKWITRAWTYQERELSTRTLIFSERQAYFGCNQKSCQEDCGHDDVSLRVAKALQIRPEKQRNFNSYRRAVESFTKRSLTFEADILNAFAGMMALLQPAFRGEFLFGLPETELDITLLWQPCGNICRRIDKDTGKPLFPSWSWAGWVGPVCYRWSRHLLDDVSRVQWFDVGALRDEDRFFTSEEHRFPSLDEHQKSLWQYVIGSDRDVPYYFEAANPDLFFLHPTILENKRPLRTRLKPGSHELRFKAFAANFIVTGQHVSLDKDPVARCSPESVGELHILCPLAIFDKDGFVAGIVYVPGSIASSLKVGSFEFVSLSRRRGESSDTNFMRVYKSFRECHYPGPASDFQNVPSSVTIYPGQSPLSADGFNSGRYNKYKPWPLYNVMMIERNGGIAYRLGLGIIHIHAFIQAGPEEKLIVLA